MLARLKRWLGAVARQPAELARVRAQMDEIIRLESQNSKTMAETRKLLADSVKLQEAMEEQLRFSRGALEALRATVGLPIMTEVREFGEERVLDMLATVNAIADEQLSFARFGDGELRLMFFLDRTPRFQEPSVELAAALRSTLAGPHPDKLLIGLPIEYNNSNYTRVWAETWTMLRPMLEPTPRFGKTHATRPLYFQITGAEGVAAWRRVWEGRQVTLITGAGSRFVPIPQLFDNVASLDRIDSVATGAFDDFERVVSAAVDRAAELCLIALGPTGTLVAAELARRGLWAVDVGHINDSYEHIYHEGLWPEDKPLVRKP